jgi:hypothetical protein
MCEKWIDFAERFIKSKVEEKTLDKVLAQTNKTNSEKLAEWLAIEKKFHWLVSCWFTTASSIERFTQWENYIKPSAEKIAEEREKVAEAVLEMLKAQQDWKYTVLYSSKGIEKWKIGIE